MKMIDSKALFGTIFEIGDCLVSEEVITEYFACDYAKCKGQDQRNFRWRGQ